MKKIALLFSMLFVLAIATNLKAQDYKSAIGLRLGYPISASYKFFVSDNAAIEAYAGFRGYTFYRYINFGAMYQVHKPISSVDGLYWYFGGGVSALLYTYDSGFVGDGNFGVGINGVLGLDYKFADAPINLSADWMPTIYLTGYLSGFGGGLGALSARYTLN
jgi:hypothetical protein